MLAKLAAISAMAISDFVLMSQFTGGFASGKPVHQFEYWQNRQRPAAAIFAKRPILLNSLSPNHRR
jgi:hypothetical protein